MAAFVKKFSNLAGVVGGAGLVGTFLYNSCTFLVQPGERAIIFDRYRGVKPKVYGEGLHLRLGGLQWPITYNIRITPTVHKTETASKDLQTVRLAVRMLHQPSIPKLGEIYQNVGTDYSKTILPSIGNEVLKAVVADFDADELVTQREAVSADIRARLIKRAKYYNIILKDVSITSIEFSPEYTDAIEQKQVEQQLAEREKFQVERKRQEQLASVIRVEGETEAGRLISEAMKISPEFLELRRIEAARRIAKYLARSRSVVYVPNKGNLLLNVQ
mmetsp:Transcript_168/g.477  ORF Transcript_168/g.477 Transcript_168/m.477 type:complete len:274 (+) Transcript_168:141-962(+)|eukprot:CAMPEP_0119131250 /NCGR_PEP_ID=MMETSP1310-20130426/9846_1 /TAXON_ID=464262 /ORGANISM="Genus nov. species nov., Strain RCC2339" /LENGTH=273 /DNA_ID=CAMNT_0007121807 /DNA_START=119 /DNA_END=940 /DNA_ORIENTATION=-